MIENKYDEAFRVGNKLNLLTSAREFRSRIYKIFPKSLGRKIKFFYYDRIAYPINCIKNKLYYGIYDFIDSVGIETTTYCNLRCEFCPNSKYDRGTLKNKKLMPTWLYKKIIDELAEINYRGRITPFFFGEPLSDKRMPLLVKYTRDKLPKAKIHLNSNGFLLTVQLYKKLIEAGIDSLRISQYGTVMPEGVRKVLGYLETRPEDNKLNYRKFTDNLALSNRGGDVKIKYMWEKPVCTYPENECNIDYDGNAVICCADYHSNMSFGNVKDKKLIDIWNSPLYKKTRHELRNYIFKTPMCKKCNGIID